MRRMILASVVVAMMAVTGLMSPASAQGDLNCPDFPNVDAAQQTLLDTWPRDPHGLDRNNNGLACENSFDESTSLPNAKDQQPDPTSTPRPDTPTPAPTDVPDPTTTTDVTPDPTAPSSTETAAATQTDPPVGTPVVPDQDDDDTPPVIDNRGDDAAGEQDTTDVTALPTTGTGEQYSSMPVALMIIAISLLGGSIAYGVRWASRAT